MTEQASRDFIRRLTGKKPAEVQRLRDRDAEAARAAEEARTVAEADTRARTRTFLHQLTGRPTTTTTTDQENVR